MQSWLLAAAVVTASVFAPDAHAEDKIYGCWDDVVQARANPDMSATHRNTMAIGDILCFKSGGTIEVTHVGGFEALGTSGRFSYNGGRLTLSKREPADAWPFAFGSDHCHVVIVRDALTINGCKSWEARSVTYERQRCAPGVDGLACSVSR